MISQRELSRGPKGRPVLTSPDQPEPTWAAYSTIPGFEHLYLEDSYVLAISEKAAGVRFEMEFVLTAGHRDHQSPKPGEAYCYRRGILRFPQVAHVHLSQSGVTSQDATGETDMGIIDSFESRGQHCRLEGDWGQPELVCGTPCVTLV